MRRRSPRPCALGAQDVVTLANRSRLQSVADARAARIPPGAGAVDHAVLGARVPRAAAEFPRRLGRRDHPRAGRHHRRCQSRLARTVRLLGRRCADRHAADGSVRAGDASGAEGRAGRLPAGQVDRPRAQGAGAALGRLQPAARADAAPRPTTRTSRPSASAYRRATSKDHDLEAQLAEAVKNDATTRFLQQRYLIAAVRARCATGR